MDGKYDILQNERIRKLEQRMSKFGDVVSIKNNLTANRTPTATDDETQEYGVGSTWIYAGVTYLCTNATAEDATWIVSNDMYYFATWAALETALNELSVSYVGKFATVANANGGPSPETGEYQAPGAVWAPVFDGGSAIYQITAQAEGTFTVSCKPRTVINPVVTKVFISSEPKPTIPGYYIFATTPSDGLPAGVEVNDILCYNGTTWSVYQRYSNATAVLVASSVSSLSQVTWRKFAGSWMSTADEFIPDGLEYQTGKLYNGKPVFRQCASGKTGNSVGNNQLGGLQAPSAASVLTAQCMVTNSEGYRQQVIALEVAQTRISPDGKYVIWFGGTSVYADRPFIAWIEYIKS